MFQEKEYGLGDHNTDNVRSLKSFEEKLIEIVTQQFMEDKNSQIKITSEDLKTDFTSKLRYSFLIIK